MGLRLVGAVCALGMMGGSAQAHIIETTFTGTVTQGSGPSLFGNPNTSPGYDISDLTGDSLKFVSVADESLGIETRGPNYDDLYQVAGSIIFAYIEINGVKIPISGDEVTHERSGDSGLDFNIAQEDFSPVFRYVNIGVVAPGSYPASFEMSFLTSSSSSGDFQVVVRTPMGLQFVQGGFETAAVSVLVDPPISAAPEPSTWALMLAGVGMVGAALRHRWQPSRVAAW